MLKLTIKGQSDLNATVHTHSEQLPSAFHEKSIKEISLYFHVYPSIHFFMFLPVPLVCKPFLIRVLSHLSSISKCLPPQGLWATTPTAIWPTTTSDWEGAPEAPAG